MNLFWFINSQRQKVLRQLLPGSPALALEDFLEAFQPGSDIRSQRH